MAGEHRTSDPDPLVTPQDNEGRETDAPRELSNDMHEAPQGYSMSHLNSATHHMDQEGQPHNGSSGIPFEEYINTGSDDERILLIQRSACTQLKFDEISAFTPQQPTPIKEKLIQCLRENVCCSRQCMKEAILAKLPFIETLRTYKIRQYLLTDIIAGLTVGVIHIPQGMGFALLTSVPAVYGLYSSFFPVLIYFFFGTSRHLSMGTMAVVSLMVGAVVEREVGPPLAAMALVNITNETTATPTTSSAQEEYIKAKVGVATAMSLLVGIIQVIMSFLRLGAVTTLMSQPFVGGFTTGASCHIVTSQVKFMLGLQIGRFEGIGKLPLTYIEIFKNITKTNIAELIIAITCMIVLIFVKECINDRFKSKLKIPIPAELLVVILGTVISHFAKLEPLFNVKIVGNISSGFPAPMLPSLAGGTNYITDAIVTAIVSFAISISMAKIFTRKHNYQIDNNQEMLAYGLCNGASAFFHCFAGAAAPPRCVVHDTLGGKTQVAGLFSSLLLLLVIMVIGPLFKSLPNSVLAAIIVVALFPVFKQFKDWKQYWYVNKYDLIIWVSTWLAVTFLDIGIGLGIGILVSLFVVVVQATFSKGQLFGNINNSDLFAQLSDHKVAMEHPGIKVYHHCGSLFYANAEPFKENLFAATVNPNILRNAQVKEPDDQSLKIEKHKAAKNGMDFSDSNSRNKNGNHGNKNGSHGDRNDSLDTASNIKAVIIDCSMISYIDVVGLNMLKQLTADFGAAGIKLLFACVSSEIREKMEYMEIVPKQGRAVLYPTVLDAVAMAADPQVFATTTCL